MNLFFSLRKKRSGEIARNRLKLLLVADKMGCSPELLEMLKSDMCYSISKYMDVDLSEMEMGIRESLFRGSDDTIPTLYTYIPIHSLTYKGTFE
jgi:cell division topological specificity factor